MIQNYFKVSIRNLLRYRIYTLINLLGLTLGISGSIVVYTILKNEASFDNFHSKASRTFRVVQHNHTADGTQYWSTTAYPLAGALRKDFPALEVTQAAGPLSYTITIENGLSIERHENDKVLFVDREYLEIFDFEDLYSREELWIAGNPDSAFEHPNSVVLTQKLVDKYFKENFSRHEEVLGKTIKLNNKDILVVRGVIKDPPPNSTFLFEILIPFEFFKLHNEYQANNWSGNYQGTTFLVLPENANVFNFEEQVASFKKKYLSAEDNKRIEYQLQPLENIHTETLYGASPGSYIIGKEIIRGMILLGVFLLIVACVNFINLATVQSVKRAKEVGIRKVLGGTRKQLLFQYMNEALVITLTAVLLSFVASEWAVQKLNEMTPFLHLNFVLDLDLLILGFILLIAITFLSGFYPSLILSSFSPVLALKDKVTTRNKSGFSLRQLLIVLQFSIAQLLIIGTVIVANQMSYIQSKDLGFKKEEIITVGIPDVHPNKLGAFRQRLLQMPAIEQISYATGAPTSYLRQYGTSFRQRHEPVEMMREAEMKVVDQNYLSLYQLQMIEGKWLSDANIFDNFNGFVVNESLVKMLGLQPKKAIGTQIIINEGEAPIIGVVKDFHNNSLQEEISPCLLFYWGTGFLDEEVF